MPFRLAGEVVNSQPVTSRVHSLTHFLDEVVYDLESLRCCRPSLLLRESVQPLEDPFDVLLSKQLPNKLCCIILSKVTHLQEKTHNIGPV